MITNRDEPCGAVLSANDHHKAQRSQERLLLLLMPWHSYSVAKCHP